MVFLLNNDCPETYRICVLLCFRQFVRTVQCVASWNAQQHIIVLLLQTSIVSLLFMKWPFIGRKVLFLDAFLHSSRLYLPGLNKGRPSLFSLCSWKENGEHKCWNFCFLMEMLKAFYILHWNKNEAFWNVAWESREEATHADCGWGESKGLLSSSPERISFESTERPRTDVRERMTAIARSRTGQGGKPAVWCLYCSSGSQETWRLALRSQVSAQMGDSGASLSFRPAVPQQARNFLKKRLTKAQETYPMQTWKAL